MQCVAVWCSVLHDDYCLVVKSEISCPCVLQYVAVCGSMLQWVSNEGVAGCCRVLQCVTVCCSVLQDVAVCRNVSQCVAVRCRVLQRVAVCCSVLRCAAVCCSVLQCVAVCCSVLQCVAVFSRRFKYPALDYTPLCMPA